MFSRSELKGLRRCVVKIGSALLTDDGQGLNEQGIVAWAEQISWLREQGTEVVLVSSGAVAAGMVRLGLSARPKEVHQLQAAAAVGQMGLVQLWESGFNRFGLSAAQILLTHDDLSSRTRYLNARSTLLSLLDLGVVPVVNENDTVVTDEIRFGDNDTLAALVANLVGAEVLVVLTDQDGLFERDPRAFPGAKLIGECQASDSMLTKLSAARLAARSGACTALVNGREGRVIRRLFEGEVLGTLLLPDQAPVAARKQWLAGHLQMKGVLELDAGAVSVLRNGGKSLLAVGVVKVLGDFLRGDMVRCVDAEGVSVACGLVNYSACESRLIAGRASAEIEQVLGYAAEPELVHRDNLVLI